MKKYLIAGTLVVALAAPALAGGVGDNFYVVLMLGDGGSCKIMTAMPSDAKMAKMMGKYKSEAEAKTAMGTMKECGG
jgi:hypothetical protein